MEANKPNIEALSLSSLFNGRFLIPMFQRGYAWKEEQTKSLIEDLDHYIDLQEWKTGQPYILGQIIVAPSDDQFVELGYNQSLIDGQQRITSLLLLFSALRRTVKVRSEARPEEDWSNELFQLQQMISFSREPGRPRLPRLYSPFENSANALEPIVLMLDPPRVAENEGIQNLIDAYSRFCEGFEDKFIDSDESDLRLFIDVIINCVYVTKLSLDDPQKALVIFERINHRGLGLDEADLLKNMLFVNSDTKEYVDLSDKWQKVRRDLKDIKQTRLSNMMFLLRALALRSGTNVSASRLFDYWYKEIVVDKTITPKKLTIDMTNEVKTLALLAKNKTPFDESTELNFFTNLTRTFQHVPALMLAKKFGEENYELVAKCIEDRTFMFLLSGERTANFEKFIPQLMRMLNNLDENASSEEILGGFKNLESEQELTELLERASLRTSSLLYGKAGDRRKQRYMISRVVKELNSEAGIRVFSIEEMMKQSRINSSFELDHVYPKSADPGLALGNSIGNLVLLAAPLNHELQATLPLTKTKVDAYVASNNMFNYAISLGPIANLPNSQKQVVERVRAEWLRAFAELHGDSYLSSSIDEIVKVWDDRAVASVSRLYWNLFREQLVYL